jgi:hypothetical protein
MWSRLVILIKSRAFLSSSVVERSTVNRLVASSNLAWGVYKKRKILDSCPGFFFGFLVINTDAQIRGIDQNLRDPSYDICMRTRHLRDIGPQLISLSFKISP